MRSIFRLLIFSAVPIVSLAQHVTFDLREQTDESDVIVVGQVSSVHETGTTTVEIGDHVLPAKVFDAEVHVDKILKGTSVQPRAVVRFRIPISPAGWVGYSGVDAATYRIFFLKRADDHFELANPSIAPLPAAQGTPQSKATDTLGAVISELSAALGSVQTVEQEKFGVIYRLGSTANPAVLEVLRPQLTNSSAAIRAAVAAALLQQNYLPALAEAQKLLMGSPSSIPSYLLENLSSAIGRYVKDDRAIPSLSVLLSAPDVQTRRAAANALRNTASKSAIPALTLGLRDSDSEVRFYAVIGLAEITDQPEWRPLREDFKANENKYMDYWLQWTAAHSVSKSEAGGVG